MSFTYDLSDEVGTLRLRVGDSVEGSGPRPSSGAASNFSDEEMQHFLTVAGNVGRATVLIFETLAAEWAVYTNITLGPRKEEFSKISEMYSKRAETGRVQFGGGSSFSVGWDRVDGYSEAADAEL